jgi:hypothetical protein
MRASNEQALMTFRAEAAKLANGFTDLIQMISIFASDYPIVIEAQTIESAILTRFRNSGRLSLGSSPRTLPTVSLPP